MSLRDEVIVQRDTYTREFHSPAGTPFKATFRPLNAGDRAEFNELRIYGEGDGRMPVGRIQILMVERALVEWEIPDLPITPETIGSLDPVLFDQLYQAVSLGNPTAAELGLDEPDPTEPHSETTEPEPEPGPGPVTLAPAGPAPGPSVVETS